MSEATLVVDVLQVTLSRELKRRGMVRSGLKKMLNILIALLFLLNRRSFINSNQSCQLLMFELIY